jgi:hypothetical protein
MCNLYLKVVPNGTTGRPALNPRIVLGSLIIKHMCNFDDRETINQISENIYMQYFLGYPALLDAYQANDLKFPLNPKQQKYFWVIQTLYNQHKQMYATIILVLNLVKLAGVALLRPILNFWLSFSADPIY